MQTFRSTAQALRVRTVRRAEQDFRVRWLRKWYPRVRIPPVVRSPRSRFNKLGQSTVHHLDLDGERARHVIQNGIGESRRRQRIYTISFSPVPGCTRTFTASLSFEKRSRNLTPIDGGSNAHDTPSHPFVPPSTFARSSEPADLHSRQFRIETELKKIADLRAHASIFGQRSTWPGHTGGRGGLRCW